jgi:hypothetical protein
MASEIELIRELAPRHRLARPLHRPTHGLSPRLAEQNGLFSAIPGLLKSHMPTRLTNGR